MKSYTFQFPFQGNRKGDIVTEDKFGQLLVKSNEHNVRWTPKEISRLTSMGMLKAASEDVNILSPIPTLSRWSDLPKKDTAVKMWGIFPFPECDHTGFTIREGDEYYCARCNKRWEA